MDITPVNTRNGEVLNKYSWYLYWMTFYTGGKKTDPIPKNTPKNPKKPKKTKKPQQAPHEEEEPRSKRCRIANSDTDIHINGI